MEPRTLRRVAAGAVFAVLAVGGWWLVRRASTPKVFGQTVQGPIVPRDVRIRVEVLNASDVRGLARRATMHLRDMGFDVVRFAGDDSRRDSTLILDRTGHPDWARLASRAMGAAPVQLRLDSAGFVDLTVLVGRTWRAPPQTLYP